MDGAGGESVDGVKVGLDSSASSGVGPGDCVYYWWGHGEG